MQSLNNHIMRTECPLVTKQMALETGKRISFKFSYIAKKKKKKPYF